MAGYSAAKVSIWEEWEKVEITNVSLIQTLVLLVNVESRFFMFWPANLELQSGQNAWFYVIALTFNPPGIFSYSFLNVYVLFRPWHFSLTIGPTMRAPRTSPVMLTCLTQGLMPWLSLRSLASLSLEPRIWPTCRSEKPSCLASSSSSFGIVWL